jgi:lincosamide nucleotidyltransferase
MTVIKQQMLPQERLIQKVKDVAVQDERLEAVLLYGSFAYGEGDANSDIDFYLFFIDEALSGVDPKAWLTGIAPIDFHYHNEYGVDTVIFEDLIRGEFHFVKSSDIKLLDEWDGWFPSIESCMVLDRTGELKRHLERLIRQPPARSNDGSAQLVVDNLVNWMVMGFNILERKEYARAYTFQALVHNYLLKLVRLVEGQTAHWINPGRRLEHEISKESYERYRKCTASFSPDDLARGFNTTWQWAHELIDVAGKRWGTETSKTLLLAIDARFAEPADEPNSPN